MHADVNNWHFAQLFGALMLETLSVVEPAGLAIAADPLTFVVEN
jgi:hypothetical protein